MGIFSKKSGAHQWRGVIEEYRHRLPVSSKTPVVTLREGGTPLVYACVLSEMLGNNVWVKFEGINQNTLQGTFYFKSARLTQCWFNFRGELAVLTRRSHELSPDIDLHHVADIVVKMKKCTFLESNFLLTSC